MQYINDDVYTNDVDQILKQKYKYIAQLNLTGLVIQFIILVKLKKLFRVHLLY